MVCVLRYALERGIQSGMHNKFNFPMNCKGVLNRWDDAVYIENRTNKTIISGRQKETLDYYDPFEYDNLIPEFINLIEKVMNGGDLEANLKKWHSEWGPLYWDYKKHTVEVFSEEAIKFYKLWGFYKTLANKEEENILKHFNIKKENAECFIIDFFPEDKFFEREPWPLKDLDETLGGNSAFKEIPDPQYTMSFYPSKNKEALFQQYQELSMVFLFNQIEKYIARAKISHEGIKHEQNNKVSKFSLKPCMYVENLIDAIYLQFYMLFSENKKRICEACNKPFTPERIDQKYCPSLIPGKPSSCYLTAKSRRYRKNKATNKHSLS